ncbi:carnitine operon protein CaiE [Janthinobacterium sp. HH103]|uniref:phenylacetic acid degradation protein PaaY n=1 Tax=unclassified Janthinobacterium TaxID=2610881 RepID=UPI000874A55C|nr:MULTISPECIES: phenylacetic acid degradation protein PaaY [unclassified Janthinobacterium]OEZ67983.1 carnitine operon protein CaiE [Janthinobacterium sp. HH100]OEZ68515.1 carnitine operon protein CaiE [Janthinobacterium sp. HH103]OEZ99265.1 carnitine operon protein CaiE [Janthinobacterium sp. HH107]QOU75788.1 Carnitine operon protein CaiE [Janthinobacterium sp. HH102]
MVKVYEINGVTPVVHPSAYVHPSAVLIGDVIVGPRCYIGPLASIRGDFGRLILEEGANLQDTCVMHGFPGCDTVVEVDGHIGHGAVLHGCRIGRNALVGMNAVVMDNAVIGEESIVAAMSFVKAGMVVAPRSMVVGTPAKVIRTLTDDEIKWKSSGTGQYHELAVRSMQTMREVEALTQVEANRQRLNFESALPLHLHKNASAQ